VAGILFLSGGLAGPSQMAGGFLRLVAGNCAMGWTRPIDLRPTPDPLNPAAGAENVRTSPHRNRVARSRSRARSATRSDIA